MEALLPTLIAVWLAETGGKVQIQTEMLSVAFGGRALILGLLALTSAVSLLAAGFAGIWIGALMNYQAKTLLLGLALLFAASGVAWPRKKKAKRIGGTVVPTSLWRYAVAQCGDNSQFIVFAFAARGNAPLLAASAGLVGVVVAAVPAFLFPADWRRVMRLDVLRWIATALLLIAGFLSAFSALRLI
jgi:Ca2+/H+ antiporter, TMEM165/GDT1 family